MISFNTSGLGKNFILSKTKSEDTTTPPEDDDPSRCEKLVVSKLIEECKEKSEAAKAAAKEALDKAKDKANEIANDLIDKLADELGIKEYYAIHPTVLCEGNFAPNASAPGATRNATNCTQIFPNGVFNVSALLDHELKIGPYGIGIRDIGISESIQNAMDAINGLVKAFVALLIMSAALAGFSFIASMVYMMFYDEDWERVVLITNVVVSALGACILLFTSMFITIGSQMAVDKVNKEAGDVGLSAAVGKGYTALTWAAVGLMLVLVFGIWLWRLLKFRKGNRPRAYAGRPRDSEESGAHSYNKGRRPNMTALARNFMGSRR